MATETIIRSPQTIRRREPSKQLLSNKRGPSIDLAGSAAKRPRTFREPHVRDSEYILHKHRGKPPSLKIHLHATHFRFDGQDGSFAYDSPMRFVLKHLKTQTVPHDMLEELLGSGVPFYDGCLVVEVYNHRAIEGRKSGTRVAQNGEDHKKFSIHNWNPHVTPSAGGFLPDTSQLESDAEADAEASAEATDRSKVEGQEEPQITTIVLHPTEQTRHEEMLILARTPAADMRRKKGPDGAVVTTPQVPLPPTPAGAAARSGASQKMALEQSALYSFQAEALVATEPPLLLEPAENAEHAHSILDTLKHPLHSGIPPAAKERKRTTAEMAADDAQAAESERRMLIMDERIKPSARSGAGANSGENQSSAASLGFSRFKTIENVKQRLEEQDRLKKEKDALAAQEKRQQDEQAAAQARHMAQQKQREMQQQELQAQVQVRQRQMLIQKQHAQQQAQAQAQHQNDLIKQMNAQTAMQNAHQMSNNTMQAQQNGGFQHPNGVNQTSSMPAQQTPLMAHSSPMVGQNGFPMVPTSSQGAGSPPRPASAVIAQPNGLGMSRVTSQQTHNSLHNTPHMPQNGTPALVNSVPNRNMNHTPHLNPSSPMVGTPTGNMSMPNARLNGNLDNTQQNIMLQQMQQNNQQANGGTISNGQVTGMQGNGNMSPEQFQIARQMSRYHEMAKGFHGQAQQAAAVGNQALATQLIQRAQQAQAQYNTLRGRFLGTQNNGSPAPVQGTPNISHTHPNGVNGQMSQTNGNVNAQHQQQQQAANNATMLNQHAQQLALMQNQNSNLTPQQQQNIQRTQQELRRILQQHNGNIPPHIIAQMPQPMQQMLRQHQARQQLQQQQQAQARNQAQARMGMQVNGQGMNQNPAQNAQYMQNMQALRNGLAMQMQGQQGGNQANGGMNMAAMQQFQRQQAQQGQQAQQNGDLSQSFAAMQNALARGHGVP